MSDVTVEQHIFLRSQLKLSSDDITDFDVFRGQSPAVKAKVLGPVTDCTPYAVLYCILFILTVLQLCGASSLSRLHGED